MNQSDHHQPQMFHPGVALHKAQALGCDAPVKLRAAGAAVTGGLLRPEEPVMAVADLLLLSGLKAVVAVAWLSGIQAQRRG